MTLLEENIQKCVVRYEWLSSCDERLVHCVSLVVTWQRAANQSPHYWFTYHHACNVCEVVVEVKSEYIISSDKELTTRMISMHTCVQKQNQTHKHLLLWVNLLLPDLFGSEMEIQGLNKNVLSERSLVVSALEVKVGGVTEGVDACVCPAGDRQRHRVDGLQLLDGILLPKTEKGPFSICTTVHFRSFDTIWPRSKAEVLCQGPPHHSTVPVEDQRWPAPTLWNNLPEEISLANFLSS